MVGSANGSVSGNYNGKEYDERKLHCTFGCHR